MSLFSRIKRAKTNIDQYSNLDVDYLNAHCRKINSKLNKDKGVVITNFLVTKYEYSPDLYGGMDLIRYAVIKMLIQEIKQRGIEGECAELGVYQGATSRFINNNLPEKKLYMFDTFDGFDDRDVEIEKDRGFYNSDDDDSRFSDTSLEAVMKIMPYPESCIPKKGFFPDSLEGLEEKFCLVSLDCDLYKPTLDGLKYFYPRLVKGGYIIIHDYNNTEYEKGIKQAVNEYMEIEHITIVPLPDAYGSVVIVKQ